MPVELRIMNGHLVIVTKFDRWAEQLRGVVKGIEVRGDAVTMVLPQR